MQILLKLYNSYPAKIRDLQILNFILYDKQKR